MYQSAVNGFKKYGALQQAAIAYFCWAKEEALIGNIKKAEEYIEEAIKFGRKSGLRETEWCAKVIRNSIKNESNTKTESLDIR